MKRNRHQYALAFRSDQRRHIMRHHSGDRDLAPIFEPDRQAPRYVVVGDGGAGPGNSRRLRQAPGAALLLGRLQREPARSAAAIAEEFHLPPAIRTKAVEVGDDRAARRAAGREREIEHGPTTGTDDFADACHHFLSPAPARRTSAAVTIIFDETLRALRRDRAARTGAELFLFERVFEECLDRIRFMNQRFRRALLIGSPDPSWPARLGAVSEQVEVREPGPQFAAAAGGLPIAEDRWEPEEAAFDLVLAIGTLDTVNDLPLALRLIRFAMASGGLMIGAASGGDTLPQLRSAMRAADALADGISARVHPRIEPSALAPLIESAGFIKPVVDVDRVQLSYASLDRLVADLRAMAATNVLQSRPAPLTRAQAEAASSAFSEGGKGGRTVETIELLHFAAWTPTEG